MAFERIVGAGQMIVNPLFKASWMSITTKLATKLALAQPIDWDSYEEEASEKIVSYITADPRERLELGLRWLYELYVSEENLPEENQRYEKYLLLLLTKINQGGDALDKVLGRLLMDAPELPTAALNFIKECTDTNERAQLGFTLLKDLVVQRPPYREPLLKLLFDKMIHEGTSRFFLFFLDPTFDHFYLFYFSDAANRQENSDAGSEPGPGIAPCSKSRRFC